MKRGINRVLIAAAVLSLASAAWPADWPQFGGPNGDFIALDTGINKDWSQRPPEVLWRVSLSDDGYAGPSVAHGKVFIIDHQGDRDIVRALDLQTGADIWSFDYPDHSKPNYGFARSTPVFSEGKLYTLSRLGLLQCLDATTGDKSWSRHLVREFGGQTPKWQYAISPLVDGDRVIVVPGGPNACVAALDKNTGETIWGGGGSDIPGYSTPVPATINGQEQYVVFTGYSLIGVDAATGQRLWRVPWETRYDVNAALPVIMGNRIFITSGYNRGCAVVEVSGSDASIRWENQEIKAHFSSALFYNGDIYGTSDPGHLVCLDPATGDPLWRQPGFEKGGIVLVDGVIIGMDGRGGDVIMAEASPNGYRELGRIKPLGGQSWTAPIVADGKLIVRNKKAIVCLDLM